ncbi:MAG: DUF2256 domain-containing protein [Chthonomonadaceae bacterium]|nr:DUF2256 domain-containing protein [Chthonomonadaceae bacterium]
MPDKFRNPNQLPTKICMTCGKPFTWRKKWEKNWDEVKFCSDKCRSQKPTEKSQKETS